MTKKSNRKTRSIKISDQAWERLGKIAALAGSRSRGDFLHTLFATNHYRLESSMIDVIVRARGGASDYQDSDQLTHIERCSRLDVLNNFIY